VTRRITRERSFAAFHATRGLALPVQGGRPMRLTLRSAALLLTFVAACSAPADDPAPAIENIGQTSQALDAVATFGTNPAALKMFKHVPANVAAGPRPLVVVLHGCTQTAAAYEAAGWSELSDAWGFYVLYPEQNTQKNNSSGCFNWGGRWKSAPQTFVFTPEPLDLTEIERGHGENQSIKEMIDKMKADHKIDDKRVFVTGLSGGGAMAALMLAVWPDVFSGGAIFAGIPYGCAMSQKTTAEAGNCLKDYTGSNAYLARTPQAWGDLVRAAAPSYKGPYPRVSIWHGTSDSVVNNANQAQLMKQWTNANGIDQTADAENMVDGFPHAEYKDASGKTLVETYAITGQSHGTEVAPSKPIDPAQAKGPTCGKAGAYILSAGICSTYYAGKFFGLDGASSSGGTSSGGGTSGGGVSSSSSSGGASSGGASGSGGASSGGPSSGGAGDGGTPGVRSTCSVHVVSGSAPGSENVLGIAGAALVAAVVARRRQLTGRSRRS
jgi:poly(hydroxyalkanoate) depolymerase family esterase